MKKQERYLVKNIDVNSLRKHCDVSPRIAESYYPGTKYKLYRIECPACGYQYTGWKHNIQLAVDEWEHPFTITLN